MENPEEILHSLEEFTKLRPKDIPRELEEYLCFVAKTGDPVYQWSVIKTLFREKLLNVITEFYESTCLADILDIPPCPNVDQFNYDSMKTFILEKLDTFVAAPFTVQRICELLTSPRKEYNRIDKYMRALEKNILVVSTTEPGNHRVPENGDGFVNGIETEHIEEVNNDINIEEMDDTPASWPTETQVSFESTSKNNIPAETFHSEESSELPDNEVAQPKVESVITCCPSEESSNYVSIEPVESTHIEATKEESVDEGKENIDNTAVPATVQRRRNSIEPPSENIHENIEADQIEVEKEKEAEVVDEVEKVTSNEPENITPVVASEITPSSNELETVDESKSVIADSCTNDPVGTSDISEDLKVNEEMEVTNEPTVEDISDESSATVDTDKQEENLDVVSNSADSASSSGISEESNTKSETETVDSKDLDAENEVEVAESTDKVAEEVVENVLSILTDVNPKDEASSDVHTTEEQAITSTCDLIADIPTDDRNVVENNIPESDITESTNCSQEAEAKTTSSPLPTTTESSDNPTPIASVATSKQIEAPSEESAMEVDPQDTNTASTETSTTTEN